MEILRKEFFKDTSFFSVTKLLQKSEIKEEGRRILKKLS